MKVLLKRIQNCVCVLVAKVWLSMCPVLCGEWMNEYKTLTNMSIIGSHIAKKAADQNVLLSGLDEQTAGP